MATVQDLLDHKSHDVQTIDTAATVLDATRQMNQNKIGSVVVKHDDQVVGIFTERDVLRRVVVERLDPGEVTVGEAMTEKLIVAQPDTDLDDVRTIMTEQKIRHLPIVDHDGQLVGIISIGDVNAWHHRDGQITLHYMNEYIHGRV